jgi:hypothetical protein
VQPVSAPNGRGDTYEHHPIRGSGVACAPWSLDRHPHPPDFCADAA